MIIACKNSRNAMEFFMIKITKSGDLLDKALDYRAMRQDMIASNIANADTPFYRPKDIDFEQMLEAKKQKLFNKPTHKLELAKTSSMHLDPIDDSNNLYAKIYFRDGHMARNDGNSVDLDVETSEMAKNSIMYNAIVNGMKKQSDIFKAVLDYSAKLS